MSELTIIQVHVDGSGDSGDGFWETLQADELLPEDSDEVLPDTEPMCLIENVGMDDSGYCLTDDRCPGHEVLVKIYQLPDGVMYGMTATMPLCTTAPVTDPDAFIQHIQEAVAPFMP